MKYPILELKGINKAFDIGGNSIKVLDNLNLTIEDPSFVCILGHTGCGKTSLLRLICGLDSGYSGEVRINGQLHKKASHEVAMVFQDLNQLFPWKTALDNVAFAYEKGHDEASKKDARMQAESLLQEVDLGDYLHYYPHQMSGGMRQRAALVRALALNPKMLLLDEPFTAVDEVTRRKLQILCRAAFERHGITFLFVTHSIDEAALLADRIVIMGSQGGRILDDFYKDRAEQGGFKVDDATRLRIFKALENDGVHVF